MSAPAIQLELLRLAGFITEKLSVTTRLAAGHGRLEFSTPEPPVLESASGGGRSLAFALYDLRPVLPEP
jgi:hypothetical protein